MKELVKDLTKETLYRGLSGKYGMFLNMRNIFHYKYADFNRLTHCQASVIHADISKAN